jgi:hypothetical protein
VKTVPNETKDEFIQLIEKVDNSNEKLISLRFCLKSNIKGHCVLYERLDIIGSGVI